MRRRGSDVVAPALTFVFELLIVLALILLNGVFALSELAVVSSRHPRLKTLVAAGRPGARRALTLASDPGRFLSTVQIGITLVGTINGAFSGVTFGDMLAETLQGYGLPEYVAEPVGFGVVVAVITYLSLIVGELVPKQLALRSPEAIACTMAPFMDALSRIASPLVSLLDASTKLVFRLIGLKEGPEGRVTEEEIKTLVAEAESAGVLETGERQMISGVLRLGDRAVMGLMTPRTDVDWIDVTRDEAAMRDRLITTQHSRLPAGEGSPDKMVGVVQTRELLASLLKGEALDVKKYIRKAPIIPETTDALDILTILREADVPMALIHDEYGHFEGLVTPADVLEAIAGAFRSDAEDDQPHAVERDDGSWLLAGAMPADEMSELLAIPLPEKRQYQTVAGFALSQLQHLPKTGDKVEVRGWRFEIVDMDGMRIDKVLASRTVVPRRTAV